MEPPQENRERSLEDYLDGYFVRRLKEGGDSIIPMADFVLLAASRAQEQAYDSATPDNHGFFTKNLLDQLKRNRGQLTYHQLIDKTRARLRQDDRTAKNQNPQLYLSGEIQGEAIFLKKNISHRSHNRYSIYYRGGKWWIELGLMYELAYGLTFRNRAIELYHQGQFIGSARTGEISLHNCTLEPDFDANPRLIYEAALTRELNLRLQVRVSGDENLADEFMAWWADQPASADWFSWDNESAPYRLVFQPATRVSNQSVALYQGDRQLWRGSENGSEELSNPLKIDLISSLRDLAHWENIRDLDNPYVDLQEEEVEITLMRSGEGELTPVEDFNLLRSDGNREADSFFLKLESQVSQTLNYAVLYLDADFSVQIIAKGELTQRQPLIVEPIRLKRSSTGDYHLKVLFDRLPIEAASLQRDTSIWINSEELY